MKLKLLAFLTAFTVLSSIFAMSANAEGATENENIFWENSTETTTTTTTTTTAPETVSLEEFLRQKEEFERQKEEFQRQIDELKKLFEENGFSVSGNIDDLSGDVSSLQFSVDEIYSLLNTLNSTQAESNSSSSGGTSGGGVSGGGGSPVQANVVQTSAAGQTETTATETTTVQADTAPNAYLVEKAEKKPDKRDFITVTSRDGHVFYIVIDYENEDKKVYFLNQVDTADLTHLTSGTQTSGGAAPETVKTETAEVTETEPKKTEAVEKPQKKNSNTLLYVIGVIFVVGIVFVGKKKLSGGKHKVEYEDDDDFEEEPEISESDDDEPEGQYGQSDESEPEMYTDELKENAYDE